MPQNRDDETIELPLGRFQGNKGQKTPENLQLIGREKERNKFCRMLFNTQHKSSYLITGERGAGKTTFVQHCLKIYEQNIFIRYTNETKGRLLFWDIIIAMIAMITLSFLTYLTAELYFIISEDVLNKPYNLNLIPLFAFIIFIIIWPFAYGVHTIFEALKHFSSTIKRININIVSELFFIISRIPILTLFLYIITSPSRTETFTEEAKSVFYTIMAFIIIQSLGLIFFISNFGNQGSLTPKGHKDTLKAILLLIGKSITILTIPILILFANTKFRTILGYNLILILAVDILVITLLEYWLTIKNLGKEHYMSIFSNENKIETKLNNDKDIHLTTVSFLLKNNFIYAFHKAWLPQIKIKVNLGFDHLDYRRVSEAILLDLKHEFHNKFLSYKSTVANIFRIITILLIIGLSIKIRESENLEKLTIKTPVNGIEYLYSSINNILEIKLISIILAKQENHITSESDNLLLNKILFPDKKILIIDVMLILIFSILYFLYSKYLSISPILPYRAIYEEINNLLFSLSSSKKSQKTRRNILNLIRFTQEDTNQIGYDTEPLDPRTVEVQLLRILSKIKNPGISLPGSTLHRITLPAAEVTIIFDELDKLGSESLEQTLLKKESLETDNNTDHSQDPYMSYLQKIRERPIKIQQLLANMKNLISIGDARFIFIGGRDLHDEWLGNKSQRTPFLLNIFNTEIFLPSLLKNEESIHLADGIQFYLDKFRVNCAINFSNTKVSQNQIWPFFWPKKRNRLMYTSQNSTNDLEEKISQKLEVPKEYFNKFNEISNEFKNFLVFETAGNPKSLLHHLNEFIVSENISINNKNTQMDILKLTKDDIFRIQLISHMYTTLMHTFSNRMIKLDDKETLTLFYIARFLLKFHRRSFSWSEIERIDELVNIHRSPDTRHIIKTLLESWLDQYIENVHNGLYDFRYKTNFENELKYLSRISQDELASLNFTLDESRNLKDLYFHLILNQQSSHNFEYCKALGELHEFDGDYENARNYYYLAIEKLDQLSDVEIKNKPYILYNQNSITRNKSISYSSESLNISIKRLSLMLRIAMTFEFSQNIDSARTMYHDCYIFSKSIFEVLIQQDEDKDFLRSFNFLFLPLFAEAWAAEKLSHSMDAGPRYLESEINYIFQIFNKTLKLKLPDTSKKVQDYYPIKKSTFLLIISDIFKKTGNLYFFKGVSSNISSIQSPKPGYLLASTKYYLLSIHFLRLYQYDRHIGSYKRYGLYTDEEQIGPSIDIDHFSDYLIRNISSTLRELCLSTLSRVSTNDIFKNSRKLDPTSLKNIHTTKFSNFLLWLNYKDTNDIFIQRFFSELDINRKSSITTFNVSIDSDVGFDQLIGAITFWIMSSKIFMEGGYIGKSIQGYLQILEIIEYTFIFIDLTATLNSYSYTKIHSFFRELKDLTCDLILYTHNLFIHPGPDDSPLDKYNLQIIYTSLLTKGYIKKIHKVHSSYYDPNIQDRFENIETLINHSNNKQFSLYNKTKAYRVFIETHCISAIKNKTIPPTELTPILEKFIKSNDFLSDSGYHTFFRTGITHALHFLSNTLEKKSGRTALKYLDLSKQLYSMGKSYYNEISNFYFLFEDFSDSDLQFEHCIQMLGSDFTNLLIDKIKKVLKVK